MSGEAKREFLKVSVNEVSLVDEPANESPIAVMKRKETDDMSTPAEATIKNKPAADQSGAPTNVNKDASGDVEHVDTEAEGSEDVLKRLTAAVEQLVAKNTDSEVEKAKPPFQQEAEDKKAKKVEALKAQLKKAGVSAKDIASAVSIAFSKSADGGDEGEATTTESVTKDEAAMDVLEALGEVISKAKKFTPKRLAQLTEVTTKLQGLLSDLNSGKPDEGGDDEGDAGASVKKSKEGEAAPAAAPAPALDVEAAIAKALKPLMDELEAIKKTRTPSTAAPTDGDGNGKKPETTTTEKSFWSGVL